MDYFIDEIAALLDIARENGYEGTYDDFKNIFMEVLESHAPSKKKVIRGNNAPFMNNILSYFFYFKISGIFYKSNCFFYRHN